MKNIQKLPIVGVEDFKKIIDGNYYYIDKTLLIKDIEESGAEVCLFTRPRRFGKTLALSTIKYFYDIENAKENRKLFKDLAIYKTRYIERQGKHPVIYISMKDIKVDTYEEMIENIISIMKIQYEMFNLNISKKPSVKQIYDRLFNLDQTLLNTTLFELLKEVSSIYNSKVVLLIDEYDAPLMHAYEKGYLDRALSFFRLFYSAALKTNISLEKGILTGITKITKNNIFSGLNNVATFAIDSKDFDDRYGFLQSEVDELLKYYNLLERREEVQEMYDGYIFGDKEIYNPWSIMNFLKRQELIPYWVNTGSTTLMSSLLKKMDDKDDFVRLQDGETIEYRESNVTDLVVQDLDNPRNLFKLMINTGYLSYNGYEIKVPNKEVMTAIFEISRDGLFKDTNLLDDIKIALLKCDINSFSKYFKQIIEELYSIRDLTKTTLEDVYHGILTMMFYSMLEYDVKSNKESGKGYYDIAVVPKHKRRDPGYLIEIKRTDKKENLLKLSQEALLQIEEKDYKNSFKDVKKLIKIGIAFCGKDFVIQYKD